MRALITGLNGTLAPKVAAAARARGIEVIGWDRAAIPPGDESLSRHWLAQARPDAVFHLAMGSEHWAALLAAHAAEHGIPFVFTSTAMVFDHQPDGPHDVNDARSAQDDYGRHKIRCEDAVLAAWPQASIARIGWQIDAGASGNNMLAHLDQWQQREGRVAASSAWRPACSFMQDTAEALLDLAERPAPGFVHLDSNAAEGHSFERVVRALQDRFARGGWDVQSHQDYRHDQRLVGGPRALPPLSTQLPLLRGAC